MVSTRPEGPTASASGTVNIPTFAPTSIATVPGRACSIANSVSARSKPPLIRTTSPMSSRWWRKTRPPFGSSA